MSVFESADEYWAFVRVVIGDRRWVMPPSCERFLKAVRATASYRVQTIASGLRYFRAQRGAELETRDDGAEWEHPHREQRLIPDAKYITKGGRANPSGFAYLYLATGPETAMAEMRPWIEESITLGLFEVVESLRVVVCQTLPEDILRRYCEKNHTPDEIERFVWNDIARAFSRPVDRDDEEKSYLPTQILAEAFKAEGFDGVAYPSGLAQGTNLVLFDPQKAKLLGRYAYTTKRVRFDFVAVPNHAICRKNETGIETLETISADSRREHEHPKRS